jgi:hypothetical protein
MAKVETFSQSADILQFVQYVYQGVLLFRIDGMAVMVWDAAT